MDFHENYSEISNIFSLVRGYEATSAEMRHHVMDANFEQETIRDLSQKKQVCIILFLII